MCLCVYTLVLFAVGVLNAQQQQQQWDYDYSLAAIPFGQPAFNPTQISQPWELTNNPSFSGYNTIAMTSNPQGQQMQPYPPSFSSNNYLFPGPPPTPTKFTLPYASYRQQPSGEDSNPKAAITKESAGSNKQVFERFLSRFVTQLPKIAESMVQIGVRGAGTPGSKAGHWATPEFRPIGSMAAIEEDENGPEEVTSRTSDHELSTPKNSGAVLDGPASVINSMPEPSSIFSFNKLVDSLFRSSSSSSSLIPNANSHTSNKDEKSQQLQSTTENPSIDWLNTFLPHTSGVKPKEDGNALAQLFSSNTGNFLGSALDDDGNIVRSKSNF